MAGIISKSGASQRSGYSIVGITKSAPKDTVVTVGADNGIEDLITHPTFS